MEIFTTILIGAAKFLGIALIMLPIASGILFGTTNNNYDNKIAKFYFTIWPTVLLVGIGLFVMIMAFYKLGEA